MLQEEQIGKYKFAQFTKQDSYGFFKYYVAHSQDDQIFTSYQFNRRLIEITPNFVEMKKEIEIIGSISHHSIQKFIDIVIDQDYLYLILEYEAKPFFSIFDSRNSSIDEKFAKRLFRQLLEGISYLHQNGFSHGDINPNSLFFNKKMDLKLGYFFNGSSDDMVDYCYGTLNYMAPECCDGKMYDPKKADIWACGVLIYTCLAYEMPFQGDDIDSIKHSIVDHPLNYPTFFSADIVNLLQSMLEINPEKRISADEVLKSPWFTKQQSNIYLQVQPKLNDGNQQYAAKVQIHTNFTKDMTKAKIKQYFAKFKDSVQGGENLSILISEPHIVGLKISFSNQSQGLNVIVTRLRCDNEEFFNTLMKNIQILLDPKED